VVEHLLRSWLLMVNSYGWFICMINLFSDVVGFRVLNIETVLGSRSVVERRIVHFGVGYIGVVG